MLFGNKEWKSKKDSPVNYPVINPADIVIPETISMEEMQNRLGRKYKASIIGLQPLLHFIDRHKEGQIVSIAQTTDYLVEIYKGQPNVKRAINKLESINVIANINTKFKNGSYGMYYSINIENLYNIYKKELIDTYSISHSDLLDSDDGNTTYEVKIGAIRMTNNINGFSDYWVINKLNERYPQIMDYQKFISVVNNNVGELFRIKFEPTITRNTKGQVKKIGIRATSEICCYKSREKHPELPWYIRCREDVLDEYLGQEWQEYDIKGSVPRVAHFIKTGEWVAANMDPYKEIFEPCFFAWDTESREVAKEWFMRVYFGGTVHQIVRSTIYSKKYPALTAARKDEITAQVSEFKSQIDNFCGEAEGTEVFLHESCIYLNVRKELAKRGIDVIQVYDGFYFRKGELPEDIDEIVKDAAVEYYNDYIREN